MVSGTIGDKLYERCRCPEPGQRQVSGRFEATRPAESPDSGTGEEALSRMRKLLKAADPDQWVHGDD